MLILKREQGQRVFVELPDGRVVVVVVTETGRGWARLGFDAPEDVKIAREELLERAS